VFAGFASYEAYASAGRHAAVIGATIGGVAASLLLAWLPWSGRLAGDRLRFGVRRLRAARPAPSDPPARPDPPAPPHAPARPAPSDPPAPPDRRTGEPAARGPAAPETMPAAPETKPVAPTVVATAPSIAPDGAASPTRDRLQTASLAVGLVIGVITVAKEIVAAVRAIVS
jgi:hypothetical protein